MNSQDAVQLLKYIPFLSDDLFTPSFYFLVPFFVLIYGLVFRRYVVLIY
jgi:hypothetical protein